MLELLGGEADLVAEYWAHRFEANRGGQNFTTQKLIWFSILRRTVEKFETREL